MATTKIRSSSITDGQVDNADLSATVAVTGGQIADDAVTLAKMAGLVRGKIIVGDASGDPSALTVGAVNQVLKSDGTDVSWAADSGGLFSSYAVISDEKSAGTAGGTFTQDGWRTRDLNTEITDPDGIVSISSNEFTLAAGSYLIKWGAPARSVNNHKARLYDVTGTATIEAGTSEYAYLHAYAVTPSIGYARVTPSGSNVYRIEHYCVLTRSTDGFGTATNVGEPEVYTIVEILKES
jgi:hypothetical protein